MGKLNDTKSVRKYTSTKDTASKQQNVGGISTLNLPKDMKVYAFKKEGQFSIDILPYVVGKNNPMADEGYVHWERTFWVHGNVGADNKQYCCLQKNWMEACPICEYREELRRAGASDDTIKAYYPKKRQIMAIIDCDDRDKGIQIYEGPYSFGLGDLIDKKIKLAKETSPVLRFYHATGGQTVTVNVEPATFSSGDKGQIKFAKPTAIEMESRDTNYEDLLDEGKIPCLDELLKKPDYNKLKEVFHKGDDEDVAEDVTASSPTPSAKTSSNGVAKTTEKPKEVVKESVEEVNEDIKIGSKVKHPRYGTCSVMGIGEDGKLKLLDKDKNTHRAVKQSEVELIEEEEAPAAPPKESIKNLGKPKTTKKVDDDEEEE